MQQRRLYLTLANQNLAQVADSSVMDAILGNVGTLLFFRLGCLDAARLESYLKPELNAEDLECLPDHHVATRLLVDGIPVRPFVFRTHAAMEAPRYSAAVRRHNQRMLNKGRKRYTRLITEVEAEILARRRRYSRG